MAVGEECHETYDVGDRIGDYQPDQEDGSDVRVLVLADINVKVGSDSSRDHGKDEGHEADDEPLAEVERVASLDGDGGVNVAHQRQLLDFGRVLHYP